MSQYSASSFSEDPNSSWFKVFTYIRPKSKVLDVGCSSGHFGEVLIAKKNCTVDGVEPDEGDFKEAKRRLRNVYQLNIETDDLSAVAEKYDYIYFGDVIEHLVHPAESLRRVQTLLKPSGKVVFSIPNMSHISVRLMLLNGDLIYGRTGLLDVTHLHFYTHREVQRVFSEAGYAITDLSPVLIDYPKELMSQELGRAGLKVTSKFIELAAKTEASVYQFVGMAKPKTAKDQKSVQLDIVSPVDLFQGYLNDTKKYYEASMSSQKEHIAKLEVQIRELGRRSEEYRLELEILKKSLPSRIIGKARLAAKKLLKP